MNINIKFMERYLKSIITQDSESKIILMSGPRQSGKTTLAKSLFSTYQYFNYDLEEDRDMIRKKQWKRDTDCIIFDELHKLQDWKRFG